MSTLQDTTDRFPVRLDVLAAVVGLVIGIALFPLRLIASQVYITTLPFVVAGGSGLYLLTVRSNTSGELPTVRRWIAQALPAVTFLGLAAMVVLAGFGGRNAPFYYVAAWVGIGLFVQVLFTRDEHFHTGVILTQLLAFALVVRFAALYTTPGYVGIDVWTHVPNWTAGIVETHSLAPMRSEKYYASPLFHLLVAVGSMTLDVSLREALFLTVGLVVPVSILFVFTTARVFVDARMATFAAAAFAINGDAVEWGIHLIPTSLGLVFFVAILYSLTRILHARQYRGRDFLLVLLFSVSVILTHQISSFIMLVFLGSALLAGVAFTVGVFDSKVGSSVGLAETANLAGLLVFDLGLITFMWSLTPYQGSNFLETIFSYFVSTVSSSAGFLNLASGGTAGSEAARQGPGLLGKFVNYVDATGILVLLFLTIVGSLYLLHRENRSAAAYTSVVAVVVMLFFVFGFPLFGVRTFVPGRWMAFIAAPMAVVGAIGTAFVLDRSPRRTAVVVLLLLSVVYPTASVLSSDATLESPPIVPAQTRQGYTEEELAAAHTLTDVTSPDGKSGDHLVTDHPYYTVFKRAYEYPTGVANLKDGTVEQDGVVYRQYQQTGAAYFETADDRPFKTSMSGAAACRGRDVTYDDGAVRLCLDGRGPGGE